MSAWQNESQSMLRSNLESPCSNLQNGVLPEIGGPVRPNTSNMPKTGPDRKQRIDYTDTDDVNADNQ